ADAAAGDVTQHLHPHVAVGAHTRREGAFEKEERRRRKQTFVTDGRLRLADPYAQRRGEARVDVRIEEPERAAGSFDSQAIVEAAAYRAAEGRPQPAEGERVRQVACFIIRGEAAVELRQQTDLQAV